MSGERRLTGRPIRRRTEPRPFADSEDDVAAMIAAADTAGMREALSDALLLHCHVGFGPGGEIECVCGWSGQWLSRHQADAILPVVQDLAVEKAAEAWDEGFEAGSSHGYAPAGRVGPPDPPSNPYATAAQEED